jgi:hypothetical protein
MITILYDYIYTYFIIVLCIDVYDVLSHWATKQHHLWHNVTALCLCAVCARCWSMRGQRCTLVIPGLRVTASEVLGGSAGSARAEGFQRKKQSSHWSALWDILRSCAFWGFPVWRLLWSHENSSFEGACLYRSRFRHLGLGKRCSSLFKRLANRQTPVAFSGRIHSLCRGYCENGLERCLGSGAVHSLRPSVQTINLPGIGKELPSSSICHLKLKGINCDIRRTLRFS